MLPYLKQKRPMCLLRFVSKPHGSTPIFANLFASSGPGLVSAIRPRSCYVLRHVGSGSKIYGWARLVKQRHVLNLNGTHATYDVLILTDLYVRKGYDRNDVGRALHNVAVEIASRKRLNLFGVPEPDSVPIYQQETDLLDVLPDESGA